MQNTATQTTTEADTNLATAPTTIPDTTRANNLATTSMRKVAAAMLLGLATLAFAGASQATVSMPVPGSQTADGKKVSTFVAKDPPGVRCNGNLQVAVDIANVYQVPIQLVPSNLVPQLTAPAVFYGNEMIAADGKDHNGGVSYAIVSDVLEIDGVPKQAKTGLIGNANVRDRFDLLKATIKTGGN